jgi:UDP-N-acetylglucosamine diphosphorylase/glucosamine-1-phosphate N-acetyltransferase
MPEQSPLMVFDDGGGDFGPLTDRRPAFELPSGVHTTLARTQRIIGTHAQALFAPPRFEAVARLRHRRAAINTLPAEATRWLVVSGRALVTAAEARSIARLEVGQSLVATDGSLIAAHLAASAAAAFVADGCRHTPPGARLTTEQTPIVSRPWHLLDHLERMLADDLANLADDLSPLDDRQGVTVVGEAAVLAGDGVVVDPGVVLDVRKGAIALEPGVSVGANAVIEGPCAVGRGSVVAPLAYLRPNTVIGASCKVAGEISASIVGNCSNKAHYGYLGNAIVGDWVNLGAGTTVSNLKNTYGEVRMQLGADAPPENTGRRFLGPVIGDFVRTAVGTLIPTGSCVGTATMLAAGGYAPKFVPAGRFITDGGDQPVDPQRLLETARAMLARRGQTLAPAEADLLLGCLR